MGGSSRERGPLALLVSRGARRVVSPATDSVLAKRDGGRGGSPGQERGCKPWGGGSPGGVGRSLVINRDVAMRTNSRVDKGPDDDQRRNAGLS